MQSKPYLRSIRLEVPKTPEWPFNIPAIQNIERIDFHPDVTIFAGENGTGKSTLLEAIAVAMGFSPQGGTKNFHLDDTSGLSDLHAHIKLSQSYQKPKDGYFLRAESFFNVATYMDEVGYLQAYGGKSLHKQSHGESFLATILNKFKGQGLYILDEPEAALSPSRQLAALLRIRDLVEQDSQFIIATHSPILMSYPEATILWFDEDGYRQVNYEDTEHYIVMRDFINNYKQRTARLFED